MENADIGLETELRLGLPGGDRNEKKGMVLGWPPVCSYRWKNRGSKMLVKVSMDGVPFLRKIELGNYEEYDELVAALQQLFASYFTGKKLEEVIDCEYVPIYEDKDGDWMLLGDVPWEMFMASCTRLRIMKRSETKWVWKDGKDFEEYAASG